METDNVYLELTHYCDYNHPAIRDLAEEFRDKAKDQAELVKVIFNHVRDEITFGMEKWKTCATRFWSCMERACRRRRSAMKSLEKKIHGTSSREVIILNRIRLTAFFPEKGRIRYKYELFKLDMDFLNVNLLEGGFYEFHLEKIGT